MTAKPILGAIETGRQYDMAYCPKCDVFYISGVDGIPKRSGHGHIQRLPPKRIKKRWLA